MSFRQEICNCLTTSGTGPFFLAVLDNRGSVDNANVIIHAFEGALTDKHKNAIERELLTYDAAIQVKFQIYHSDKLLDSRSLREFADLFQHQEVLLDPTGAYERINAVLKIAQNLRGQFDTAVKDLYWETTARNLVVVAPRANAKTRNEILLAAESIAAETLGSNWVGFVQSVEVTCFVPARELIQIEKPRLISRLAVLWPRRRMFSPRFSPILKAIGLASIVGVSTAAASVDTSGKTRLELKPGVSALVDMTTLGQNAYGTNNLYRAMGGLRLYLADAAPLISPFFTDQNKAAIVENVAAQEFVETETNLDQPISTGFSNLIAPIFVAYGG
jgi:hypothetical protein